MRKRESFTSMKKEEEAWSMDMEFCCLQEEEQRGGALQKKLAW